MIGMAMVRGLLLAIVCAEVVACTGEAPPVLPPADGGSDGDADGDGDGDADGDADGDGDGDADGDGDGDSDSDSDPPSCADVAVLFDFSDAQGFSHNAINEGADPWEWGPVPGYPFGVGCHSEPACWATVLGDELGENTDYGDCQDAQLVSPQLDLTPCAEPSHEVDLRFWHYFVFEPYSGNHWWDGGTVQLSGDGGASWIDVQPTPGYTGLIEGNYEGPCNGEVAEINGHEGWSGDIEPDEWAQVTLPVPPEVRTAEFRVRFLFGTDQSYVEDGWYIDDVEIFVP